MKIVWEAKDIKVGLLYSKPGIREKWMIGYQYDEQGDRQIVSISMDDGFVTLSTTEDDLARLLNVEGYWPMSLIDVLPSV